MLKDLEEAERDIAEGRTVNWRQAPPRRTRLIYRCNLKSFTARPIDHSPKSLRRFWQLERDPRQHGSIKPLKGNLAGHYRYRVGDNRVIYKINEQLPAVFVLKIAHWSDIYE